MLSENYTIKSATALFPQQEEFAFKIYPPPLAASQFQNLNSFFFLSKKNQIYPDPLQAPTMFKKDNLTFDMILVIIQSTSFKFWP